MPFTPFTQIMLSDLVVNEQDPSVGYARRVIRVAGTGSLPIGAVVFRAAGTDPAATFAPVTAAANIATGNEYAVVFGDKYGYNSVIPLQASPAATGNAVAFVQGDVILKEYLLKQYAMGTVGLTQTQFNSLKHMLEKQGVRVEITLGDIL
jgi:hypothetical protein